MEGVFAGFGSTTSDLLGSPPTHSDIGVKCGMVPIGLPHLPPAKMSLLREYELRPWFQAAKKCGASGCNRVSKSHPVHISCLPPFVVLTPFPATVGARPSLSLHWGMRSKLWLPVAGLSLLLPWEMIHHHDRHLDLFHGSQVSRGPCPALHYRSDLLSQDHQSCDCGFSRTPRRSAFTLARCFPQKSAEFLFLDLYHLFAPPSSSMLKSIECNSTHRQVSFCRPRARPAVYDSDAVVATLRSRAERHFRTRCQKMRHLSRKTKATYQCSSICITSWTIACRVLCGHLSGRLLPSCPTVQARRYSPVYLHVQVLSLPLNVRGLPRSRWSMTLRLCDCTHCCQEIRPSRHVVELLPALRWTSPAAASELPAPGSVLRLATLKIRYLSSWCTARFVSSCHY